MTDQLRVDHGGIGAILKRHRLTVPPNQRDYAWTHEVRTLYQDLARAYNDDVEYFLGTIVTISGADSSDDLEVVDGQQRLATTSLLIAAIRDYDRELGEAERANSISSDYLATYDRQRHEHIPRLRLNVDDNDLFRAIVDDDPTRILPEGKRLSHKNLRAAFDTAKKHVHDIVASVDKKHHSDLLEGWITFIERRARVVLLEVPDPASAYTMFETLNDRGLRTSQADLIKNYLFGKAGSRSHEVQMKWAAMRGALESVDDPDVTINYLQHSLTLRKGYLRTPAEVYNAVQETAKGEQAAALFASQLEKSGPHLCRHVQFGP